MQLHVSGIFLRRCRPVLFGLQKKITRTKREHADVIPYAIFRVPDLTMTRSQPSALCARRLGATLTEVFPAIGAEAAAAGFIMAQLGRTSGAILWIQDCLAQRETGRPSLLGLALPDLADLGPLILMQLSRPADVMISAEEGLRCRALAAVIVEIRGDPAALNFTAMKRLALRAEATAVPCWLIRQAATADLSAARDRWRIATLPSATNPDDARAPGDPRWRVELFRSRDRRPGTWVIRHEAGTADRVDLVAGLPDGAVAEGTGTVGQRSAG